MMEYKVGDRVTYDSIKCTLVRISGDGDDTNSGIVEMPSNSRIGWRDGSIGDGIYWAVPMRFIFRLYAKNIIGGKLL